jgi:hypothetical protein
MNLCLSEQLFCNSPTTGLDPQRIIILTVLIRISVSFLWKQSGVWSSEIIPLELAIEY